MKILHTSDWHLGAELYESSRQEEHQRFLDWLLETIKTRKIDVLLVAGDIFDNVTPSAEAQRVYYTFLGNLKESSCREVVVIGGNHDSPALLNAPASFLANYNIHVIGKSVRNPEQELVDLHDSTGKLAAIVCAVPYLRDREVLKSSSTLQDRSKDVKQAVLEHYSKVFDAADARAKGAVPIIGLGHFFATGSEKSDGETKFTVGTLDAIPTESFLNRCAYFALGHIHSPQQVGSQKVRYSGSPLPMSFGERRGKMRKLSADPTRWDLRRTGVKAAEGEDCCEIGFTSDKKVCIIDTEKQCAVEEVLIPRFRELVSIRGEDKGMLEELVKKTVETYPTAFIEVEHKGVALGLNLHSTLSEIVEKIPVQDEKLRPAVLRVREVGNFARGRQGEFGQSETSLDDIPTEMIFCACLDEHGVPEEERKDLLRCFEQAERKVHESGAV